VIELRESEIGTIYNSEHQPEGRFVSDAEASRRIHPNFIDPDEVVEARGNYNSLDGTHPHTQEEADARDAAYLGQLPQGE